MKTTMLSVMCLGAALAFAGCSRLESGTGSSGYKSVPQPAGQRSTAPNQTGRPSPDHVIKIEHEHYGDDDSRTSRKPMSALTNYWVLKEKDGGGDGALRNMPVKTNEFIKWKLHRNDGFSIVVTNINEWKISEGETSNWRTDAPCPFNGTNYGFINATNDHGKMVVELRFKGSLNTTNYGYWIAVPNIDATLVKARMITNYDNMVEATLIWDSSRKDR